MEIATIKGEPRPTRGRNANERVRRSGFVPAVIYGHKEAPETVALLRHDLQLALEHMVHVVQVEVNGKQEQYLLKEVQYDHLQETPIHVDLMRVDKDERVEVRVPIELRGEPKGVHEGGVLQQVMMELEVECGVLAIPELLRPNVEGLGVNDSLYVRDIKLPEGVRPLADPDDAIATVKPKREVDEAVAEPEEPGEEGAAEPEVIRREREEEEGED